MKRVPNRRKSSRRPEVEVHLGSLRSNRYQFVQQEEQQQEVRSERKEGQVLGGLVGTSTQVAVLRID